MTKTILELAREVQRTSKLSGGEGYYGRRLAASALVDEHERIIELCEAIEKLIHSIEVHTHIASDNAPDTCAECGRNIRAQAHRYVGEPSKEVQQREAIAFARRTLRGE